jgi:hypothetical protein
VAVRFKREVRRLKAAVAAARLTSGGCPVCMPLVRHVDVFLDPDVPREPPSPPESWPPRCPGCGRPWNGPPVSIIEIVRPSRALSEEPP